MARDDTNIDFSSETWDEAVQFFEGCWVVATRHHPGLNEALELNNREFVFKLKGENGGETLMAFGFAGPSAVEAVHRIEKETGLEVSYVVGNGGGHHLFLELWYEAFPKARILVPAKRIPFTDNGKALQQKYADRWELMHGPRPPQLIDAFGEQIDCVIFDQLFQYTDKTSQSVMKGARDYKSEHVRVSGFSMLTKMGKMLKDMSQPNDEVFLFHRASGLVIAGHNFQLSYVPKGYSPPPEFKLSSGGFIVNFMMSLMMPKGAFRSMLEGTPAPIADPRVHAEEWQRVLDWPVRAWTSAHDPPTVCGPDLDGEQIKQAVRDSIHKSGEDDPTGARLKWNIKHGKAGAHAPAPGE